MDLSKVKTEDLLHDLKEVENKIFDDTVTNPFPLSPLSSCRRNELEVYKSKLQAELVMNRGYKMKKSKIVV